MSSGSIQKPRSTPINIDDFIGSMTVLLVFPNTLYPHILVTLTLNDNQMLSDLETLVDSGKAIFNTANDMLNTRSEFVANIYKFCVFQNKKFVGDFSRVPSIPQSP